MHASSIETSPFTPMEGGCIVSYYGDINGQMSSRGHRPPSDGLPHSPLLSLNLYNPISKMLGRDIQQNWNWLLFSPFWHSSIHPSIYPSIHCLPPLILRRVAGGWSQSQSPSQGWHIENNNYTRSHLLAIWSHQFTQHAWKPDYPEGTQITTPLCRPTWFYKGYYYGNTLGHHCHIHMGCSKL